MKWLVITLCFLLIGCARRHPIEDARAVIKSHEAFAKAGDLEGVVSNVADDVVVLTPDTMLVTGKPAFRTFYAWTLSSGSWEFYHEFEGTDVEGDAAIVFGLVRGSLTRRDSTVTLFSNNFLMILRYQSDGKMKFWRIAYTPSSR